MAFTSTNKAPGVYIEEVRVLGPIPGVGTSTAAFVGPARAGVMGKAVRVQTWSDFVANFGLPDDSGPYLASNTVAVTHAVTGFFANGGADCWFVRVGTAVSATLALKDAGGTETLVVTAKLEGTADNATTVEVQAADTDTTLAQFATTLANAAAKGDTRVTVAAGAGKSFFKDDVVLVGDAANHENATVTAVATDTLTLSAPLANAYAAAKPLRLADLAINTRTFRVDDLKNIEVGSNVAVYPAANDEKAVVDAIDGTAKRLTLDRPLQHAYALDGAGVKVTTQDFTLVIVPGPRNNRTPPKETYANLSLDPRHSRYVRSVVDSHFVDVTLVDPPNPTPAPGNLPKVAGAVRLDTGTAGVNDGDPAQIPAQAYKDGIDLLRAIDEVNILCVPDRWDLDVQGHMIAHCEQLQDRFAILDPKPRLDSAEITAQRDLLGSDGGYAALYYPRIVIPDPRPVAPTATTARPPLTISPSGHIAGLYARVDDERGVFKAPANEILREVLDLERTLGDETQGPLNEHGINVIRRFPGRGIVVWGARTISTSTQWRYVPVRRLLLFIEESLSEGTQFVVFEPNRESLWAQVKRQVSEFLTRQWTAGALVGTTPDEAFEVRVDKELNPPASMALGQLVIQVKLYPAPPAEYVVFRIIQRPGGPEIQE
jgi:phage tail sheath protein FI